MNVRTLTAATAAAAATALLLPALHTGAAAEPTSKRPKQAGCAVTVDPKNATGAAGGPVLADAKIEQDATNPDYALTQGYYVGEEDYLGSSTFHLAVSYTPPAGGACGSISVLTFPYVVENGQDVPLPDAVQTTTAHLSGTATSVTITSLVVGLPENSKRGLHEGEEALCVGSALEVRDDAGTLVQRFPAQGALEFCPGGAGGRTYV